MANSKHKTLVDKLLGSLGVSEKELRREASSDVLIPKMSLIGILESIRHVTETLKTNILTSPGRLNAPLIRLYLTAISSSSVYALSVLDQYEKAMDSDEASLDHQPPSMDALTNDIEDSEEDIEDLQKELDEILKEEGYVDTARNKKTDKKNQN